MSDRRAIHLVSYAEDPLETLLDLLFRRHAGALPDLSRVTILLQHPGAAPRLRKLLIERVSTLGHAAVLPPSVLTLEIWARQFVCPDIGFVGENARELMMFNALREFPGLTERLGTWSLIDNLFRLFDELTFERYEHDSNSESLRKELASSYDCAGSIGAFADDEATLVHTLWTAWGRELSQRGALDSAGVAVHGLGQSLKEQFDPCLYYVGTPRGSRVERDWMNTLLDRGHVTLVLQGQTAGHGYHPDAPVTRLLDQLGEPSSRPAPRDPYTVFLNSVYADPEIDLRERAKRVAADVALDRVEDRLAVFRGADLEDEARAIDVQVRRWLLQGLKNIGIVTADRKLARRARALLERAGIQLRDAGGWALSTTSAATVLARWLDCVEHNFYYEEFLDVLKSPFLHPPSTEVDLRTLTDILEYHVFMRLNVTTGLHNCRRGVSESSSVEPAQRDALIDLLDWFERAAAPIIEADGGQGRSVHTHFGAFTESMDRLGVLAEFAQDEAGKQLLEVLDELRAAAVHYPTHMRWSEFCQWLRRELERRNFRPDLGGSGVELMGIAESRLYRFSAVFIAGCTSDYLPTPSIGPLFLNDRVRASLGLSDRERRYSEQLHDFRRLLESGQQVCLSYRATDRGEPVQPSPWLERLDAFFRFAYGRELHDAGLTALARAPETLCVDDRAARPHPQTSPAVRVTPRMIPMRFSASALQRLVDCPYQFYVTDCLGLKARQEVSDDLEKSQFGQLVHRVLHAFHENLADASGPWRQPLKPENLKAAETLLRKISNEIFSRDLARGYGARAWLDRWLGIAPHYLRWELEHAQLWRHLASEAVREHRLSTNNAIRLTGRIDRLLHGPAGYIIVDYKTGATPDAGQIATGELVQLPFYAALFDEPVEEAVYLHLLPSRIVDQHRLSGRELEDLVVALRARLAVLVDQMQRGTRLPAWGDFQTCRRCSDEGLCRKSFWLESGANKKAAFRPPQGIGNVP